MAHAHESPLVMTIPLGFLALGAIGAGYLGLPMVGGDHAFWAGSIHVRDLAHNAIEAAHHVPLWVKLLPVIVGLAGLALAWVMYVANPLLPGRLANAVRPVYLFSYNKWYFDELYDAVFVRPARNLGTFLWRKVDAGIIDDWGPNGVAASTLAGTKRIVRLQSGYIYHYAFVMLIGVAALVTWYLLAVQG
jgi:NADH-quinone oxidoreductase subunit L